MDIDVSVVVLLTKETNMIGFLLNSLMEQSLTNMEIIIEKTIELEAYSEEIDSLRESVSAFSIAQFDSETTVEELLLEGYRKASGKYTLAINENCYLESRTLEELCEVAEQNDTDIVHFQVNTVPAEGVTAYQALVYASEFNVQKGELEQSEMLQKCYIEKRISKRLIGKLIKTDTVHKAINYTEKYGCPYEETVFFFCVFNSKKCLGMNNKSYMNYSVTQDVLLQVCNEEFEIYLDKKRNYDAISFFVSEFSPDYENLELLMSVAEETYISELRRIIVLWASNRIKDYQKQHCIGRIADVWGIRDTICGLASWAQSSKEYYFQYITELVPKNKKTKYHCVANFSSSWKPFDDCAAGIKTVRLLNEKLVDELAEEADKPAELTDENSNNEIIVCLPKPEGVLWYRVRFDAIEHAIHEYDIDAVCFKNCEIGSIWDILCARYCGASIYIYDKEVKTFTSLFRQNDLPSYFKCFYTLLFADVAVIPENTAVTDDVSYFGINYSYTEEDALAMVSKSGKLIMNDEARAYLNHLLLEKYHQETYIKQNALQNVNNLLEPYKTSMIRLSQVGRLRKGLRNMVWRDKFRHSSVIGKAKLLLKTLLKLLILRNLSLGLQEYQPRRKKEIKAVLLNGLIALKMLVTDPRMAVEKIQQRIRWNKACEKRISNGKENPDKTFYLVRLNPGNDGLLLSYLRILRELQQLDNTNYTPVIDMSWTYYVMAHNSKRDVGRINGWDMYFKPVSGYSLEDIMHSKNIVRGRVCYREQIDNYYRSTILRNSHPEADGLFEKWCSIDKKYISLKPSLLDEYEEEYDRIIGGKRTIGIMIREGYAILNKLNYALIANHAVQPEMDSVIKDLSVLLEEWNCEQIFVSAEYKETVEKFREAFGDKVVFTVRNRKNFSAEDSDDYRTKREKYYAQISREEINRDYLKEVYLLSRCTCLLAGRASASIVASIWNDNKYEHRKIYDLGKYHVNNSKPMVSLTDKQ